MRHHYEYVADKPEVRERFMSLFTVLAIFLITVLTLFVFFPAGSLVASLQTGKPSMVTAAYLKNIVAANPSNQKMRLIYIRQLISLGEFFDANVALKPLMKSAAVAGQAKVLQYLLLRQRMYAAEPGTLARLALEKALSKVIKSMVDIKVPYNDLLIITRDATYLKMTDLAGFFLEQVRNDKRNLSVQQAVRYAKEALAIMQYKLSAKFYFLAQRKSKSIVVKRRYFLAALRSLQMSGRSKLAVELGKKNIGALADDRVSTQELAKIALQSDAAKEAQKFMRDSIGLEYKK